ncbi:MAG: iron-containing alcohol dehydrogenase [Holophaga sp.]
MQNVAFHNPTKLLFGRGQVAALASEIPPWAKVLVTYGSGSIKTNPVYAQVLEALQAFQVIEFSGIEANPSYETLMRAVEIVRAEGIGFLVALGGGPALDGTKFIAVAAPFPGDPWDICAHGAVPNSSLPVGAVLTLPATGSEANGHAAITRLSTREKLAFAHPLAQPKFAIMDPEHTLGLPKRPIANGVVDAFVQVTEQYLTYPAEVPVQDRLAEGLLATLIEEGPRTLAQPKDYPARCNVMWCTLMAFHGLVGCGAPWDGSTHAIAHELCAFHGLDTAQALAIVLPNLLWVQREAKAEKLLQYAERVWQVREGSPASRVAQAIIRTRNYFESLGVGTHLSDYNIGSERFDEILARLEAHQVLPLGERQDLGLAKLREILMLAR